MGVQPVPLTAVSTKPNVPFSQPPLSQPPRFQAPQVSVSMQAKPAPNVRAVSASSELVSVDERQSSPEANAAASHIRVFLAPRTVVYPSLPNSASAGNGKKQILVKAIVNADGMVDDVQVPGQSPGIATAIAKTVKQWRYQPYLLNGQPVEVETRMIFTVLGPDAITVRFLPAGEDPAND
jgi:Gram-negative bacterial TonB protein C-terminal